MKRTLKVLLFLLLILPSTQISAQFDINVTPGGLVTIKYLGCNPCNSDFQSCLEIIECREECKTGFDFDEAEEQEMDCWYDCYYDYPPGGYDCDSYCRDLAYGEYDNCVESCGTSPAENPVIGFEYQILYVRSNLGSHPFAHGMRWSESSVMTDTDGVFSYQVPNAQPVSNYCIRLSVTIFYADGPPCTGSLTKCFIFG